jgi:hypothetical protein
MGGCLWATGCLKPPIGNVELWMPEDGFLTARYEKYCQLAAMYCSALPRPLWPSRPNPGTPGSAIPVGISLLAAENLRAGSVWKWFMANPESQRALNLAEIR